MEKEDLFIKRVIDNLPKDIPVEVKDMWLASPRLLRQVLHEVLWPKAWRFEQLTELPRNNMVLTDNLIISGDKKIRTVIKELVLKRYRNVKIFASVLKMKYNTFFNNLTYFSKHPNSDSKFAKKLQKGLKLSEEEFKSLIGI